MTIYLKFKCLLTLALLISFSSFAEESTTKTAIENIGLAPEATAAEATLSFRNIPYLKKAFIDTAPAARKGDLAVGELGINGGNKKMIVKLAKELAVNKHGDYDSLLIAHKGKFLFESYYKRGRIDLPHFQSSVTKGYTSLLLGRAIQLGYLTMADLDKPLVSFLKGLDPTKFVDGVEKITLHQALTMRSGLRFSDEENTKFRENPEIFKGLDQVQAFLELSEPINSKSQIYKYQGPDPIMVMQVLDTVVPGSAKDFIKNEFFGKLGITNYKWRDDKSGLPIADERSSMTSRDMLKLGVLVTDEGQWNGEQLLSADYLAKATSAITRATEDWQEPETFFYGYLWYQTDVAVGDKSYDVKIAWGGGGNRVISVEALDLVIVITGLDWDDKIFTQVSEKILPAFIKLNRVNSQSQDEFPGLEGPYLGQKPPGLIPELFAPDIIQTEHREAEAAFTPDLKEFYFRRRGGEYKNNTLVVIQYKDNRWTESVVPPRAGEPFISTDGKILYLGNKYRERTNSGWSEVKSLGPMFDRDDFGIMRITASAKGTYVFDDYKSNDVIRISTIKGGKREEPKLLGKEINVGKWTAHPFIAPDDSYLIWDSEREGGYGDSDLYISFRQKGGSWGAAINLGDTINTELAEAYGSVSSDGKYFFFHRGYGGDTGDIFWVDAQFVEELRPKL